jgi:hypothetical protein
LIYRVYPLVCHGQHQHSGTLINECFSQNPNYKDITVSEQNPSRKGFFYRATASMRWLGITASQPAARQPCKVQYYSYVYGCLHTVHVVLDVSPP